MGVFSKTETGRVVVQDGGGGSSEDGGWKARRAGAEIKDIFASGHDVSFELGYIRRAVPVHMESWPLEVTFYKLERGVIKPCKAGFCRVKSFLCWNSTRRGQLGNFSHRG